jgi:hypothetical protein
LVMRKVGSGRSPVSSEAFLVVNPAPWWAAPDLQRRSSTAPACPEVIERALDPRQPDGVLGVEALPPLFLVRSIDEAGSNPEG